MLANRSPAIYREMRDTNWAGLDGATSGWDATSKSANWADCGEYFSAGLLRMTGKTQLCPADYHRHMKYDMQADTGLSQGMYFVDSCCSKTIVKDVRHLKNITLMTTPAKVAGLTGITEIQHQADLYMPVKDVRGKQTTIILKGVYFDPNIKYNLISVNDLANISHESQFGQRKSSIQGSAGTVPHVHTLNVYALEVMEQGRTMAMAAVNKMTAMVQTHLNFSHCISEKKLVQMSKAGVPGVPKGLKETGGSCVICQHAKIIRNNAAQAATGSDPHCISWDMIDVSKIPTITGKQYCTMIVERKTRFAHIVLHDSKSEDTIIQIFTRVLPLLTEKPIIVKSDCAQEYHTPKMEAFLKDVHGVKEMRQQRAQSGS